MDVSLLEYLIDHLGVPIVVAVVLGIWIRYLIVLLQDEKKYSRSQDGMFLESLRDVTAAVQEVEKALAVLLERVK